MWVFLGEKSMLKTLIFLKDFIPSTVLDNATISEKFADILKFIAWLLGLIPRNRSLSLSVIVHCAAIIVYQSCNFQWNLFWRHGFLFNSEIYCTSRCKDVSDNNL